MPKKKIAYSYVRFSRPEQLHGDSLRRQVEASQQWCFRNGYELSDLEFRDLGKSAYRGKHRKEGKLAVFLKMVQEGKIEKGAVLLLENLDRLTRENIGSAVTLINGLLDAGIQVVTLSPERIYKKSSWNNLGQIMEMIVQLALAHDESLKKSERLARAWSEKRRMIEDKKLTGACPAWLELSEDRKRFKQIRESVTIVRRIFRLASQGVGTNSIARLLNDEEVRPIGKRINSTTWHKSYVTKILKNRAVIGEFQPHVKTEEGKRLPEGEPIADYFPAVIDEALFYRVQEALTLRQTQRGPSGNAVANLFTGIIRDARDGCSMTLVHKGNRSSGSQLVSSGAQRKERGSEYLAFSYAPIEKAILMWCRELRIEDITAEEKQTSDAEERLEIAKGKLGQFDSAVTAIQSRLLADPTNLTLLDTLSKMDGEKAAAKEDVEQLQREMHVPEDSGLADAQSVIDLLKKNQRTKTTREIRTRLKSLLRTLIREIWVWVEVEKDQHMRTAYLQMHLSSGLVRKVMVVGTTHWEGGGATAPKPIQTWAYAVCESDKLGIDLRDGDPRGFMGHEMRDKVYFESNGKLKAIIDFEQTQI